MKWSRESSDVLVSSEGYKIGRYRVGDLTYYRPSFRGSFIALPTTDVETAKGECINHFEVNQT